MKVTIQSPDSLNDIPLKHYQEFLSLEEPTNIDVIHIFLRLPIDVIMKASKVDVDRIANEIIEMFNEDCKLQPTFELNGKEFGFIPAIDDIALGEYRDATAYIQDWEDMHKAMAVLYRPVTSSKKVKGFRQKKYLIEDYEGSSKYCEQLKEMPVSIVMGTMVFFYSLLNDLLRVIPHYLLKELTEEQLEMAVSSRSGESITKSILSVRETLEGLKRQPIDDYMSA